MQLSTINALSTAGFVAALGAIYEHSPWVAEAAAAARPFDSLDALAAAMQAVVDAAAPERQLALIRAHPELAGKAAIAGELGAHSSAEQAAAGLTHCTPEQYLRLQALNAAYRERFGHPFILAVRGHTRETILAAFEARLHNAPDDERAECLRQVARIARLRLETLFAAGG